MIKAYDYYGFIDLGAEEDDMFPPYEDCPICVGAISPSESEKIYQSLCLRCARIIHTVYAQPYHPISQSAYIPVAHDSIQILGLIKMRLYNMIESFTSEECRGPVEIIKELMEQTPADFELLSLINSNLIPLLVTKGYSTHRMTYMVHTAVFKDYINLETSQSFDRRIHNLAMDRGRTTND